LKAYKTVVGLDDAGFSEIEVEVEAGFDDAGFYEIKPESCEEHL